MVECRAYISDVAGSIPASGIQELVFIGYTEVAQLVEQLTCNEKVTGSMPVFGAKCFQNALTLFDIHVLYAHQHSNQGITLLIY